MGQRKATLRLQLAALLFSLVAGAGATPFPMPANGDDVVGSIYTVDVQQGETLVDIARAHDIGQEELRLANGRIDRWLPQVGEPVTIPGRHILPDAPREGLVLNLAELRLYHFHRPDAGNAAGVATYPVSIGRTDWPTPLGRTSIVARQRDPAWHPPAALRAEAAAEGRSLPDVVPPGPNNPLGAFALRLALPGYLIHGTNRPFGIGMRVTHGCIRMLPEDIAELFEHVSVGTPVNIVDQPVKTGWHDGVLYVEVHPPLDDDGGRRANLLRHTLERVYARLNDRPAILDAAALRQAVSEMRGIPVAVSLPGVEGRPIGNPLFD